MSRIKNIKDLKRFEQKADELFETNPKNTKKYARLEKMIGT